MPKYRAEVVIMTRQTIFKEFEAPTAEAAAKLADDDLFVSSNGWSEDLDQLSTTQKVEKIERFDEDVEDWVDEPHAALIYGLPTPRKGV